MSSLAYQIDHAPAHAALRLDLQPGQSVLVERSALAAMDSWITLKTQRSGGFRSWLRRFKRMAPQDALLINEVTAPDRPGQVYVSPSMPGDICHYRLNAGRVLMVQSAGFVASGLDVNVDSSFQGLRSFFNGDSLFLLRLTGTGDVWFNAYGGLLEIPVTGDYAVDTGYVVAFEESLDYRIEVLGGLSFQGLSTVLRGGEGFVCRFRGQGRLWVQSRNLYPLLNYLALLR